MHCCYGTSRYLERAERKDVFFIRFPQKNREPVKCARWAKVCCRQKFTAESVIKDTYICRLHFVRNAGPTSDHPDPIPATATKYEVNKLMCMF